KTLWAREHVDELKKAGDVGSIIAIGTDFQIMTEHTSFVAVERSRILVAGEPRLVPVPIEMPHGQSWSGIFGRPEPQQPHVEYLGEALREAYKNVRGVDAVEAESAFGTYGVDLERFGQIVNEDKLYYRYEPMLTIGGRTATTTADFYFATPRTQSIDGYFEPAAGWAEGNVSLHLMPDATTTTALSLDSNVQLREPLQARIAQIQDLQAPRLEAQAAGLLALDEMDATRLGRMSEAQTRGFAGGGGGGGFGGGTGRGGGGSLFDSPDQVDSMTLGDMTIDQRRQAGADVVVRFVQPDAWEQNGGEVAKLGFEPTAGLAVTPLQSSAEAEALSRNVEVFGDVVRGSTRRSTPRRSRIAFTWISACPFHLPSRRRRQAMRSARCCTTKQPPSIRSKQARLATRSAMGRSWSPRPKTSIDLLPFWMCRTSSRPCEPTTRSSSFVTWSLSSLIRTPGRIWAGTSA
ncbi:MAG: hypothetical protein ACYTF9_06505, partial [Planctomycetota bacterium]